MVKSDQLEAKTRTTIVLTPGGPVTSILPKQTRRDERGDPVPETAQGGDVIRFRIIDIQTPNYSQIELDITRQVETKPLTGINDRVHYETAAQINLRQKSIGNSRRTYYHHHRSHHRSHHR